MIGLRQFQPLKLDPVCANMGKVVLRLLQEPAFGVAAKDLGQAHGHFRGMPRFSFTSSESVLRVTPRASAACVMVKPEGSIHSCNTTRPGCGGFFMVMGGSFRGNRHNQR